MAKNRLCFSVAGDFGAEMTFESAGNITYEQMAQSVNKKKVAELLFLDVLGRSWIRRGRYRDHHAGRIRHGFRR